MFRILAAVVAFLLTIASPVNAAPRYEEDARARNARAEFVFHAKATQVAAERSLGADVMALHARAASLTREKKRIEGQLAAARQGARSSQRTIEELRGQLQKAEAEAAAAQEQFYRLLSERDARYAQELAVFRQAADDILATPGGIRILELYNQGDWEGVKRLEAPLRAARQKMRSLEAAADARAFAALALDQRDKGRESISNVTARYEEVVRLDDSNYGDHFILSRLYMGQVKHRLAAAAAEKAASLTDLPAVKIYSYEIVSMARLLAGDSVGSIETAKKAAALGETLSAASGNGTDALRFKAALVLATAYDQNGDFKNASSRYVAIYPEIARLSEVNPKRFDLAMLRYECESAMGEMLERAGNPGLALTFHKSALGTLLKLHEAAPQSFTITLLIVGSVVGIADQQASTRDHVEAEKSYRLGLGILENVPPDSAGPIAVVAMSKLKLGLGNLYLAMGRVSEGRGLIEESRRLMAGVPPEFRDLR
jgi:hypothetical protein